MLLGVTQLPEKVIGVLTQTRSRIRGALSLAAPHRVGNHPVGAHRWMSERLQSVSFCHKGIVERLGDVIDRGDGYRAGQHFQPLAGRPPGQYLIENFCDLFPVLESIGKGPKTWIVFPLWSLQHIAQCSPELLLVAHDKDPAVGRPVELTRHQ